MVLSEHYPGEMNENRDNISHSYPWIKRNIQTRIRNIWLAQSLSKLGLKTFKNCFRKQCLCVTWTRCLTSGPFYGTVTGLWMANNWLQIVPQLFNGKDAHKWFQHNQFQI